MSGAFDLRVPLEVNLSHGTSWAAAKGDDPAEHWFEDVADHLGPAYLRYSFTKGTEQEVAFLVRTLGLEPECGCSTSGAVRAAMPSRWPSGASG